ncbi:MAG: hypothetical protein EXS03_08185 [Phycisphaerales bacterium]|nr:hypothetical protein [Phycisphaerales bacterium]
MYQNSPQNHLSRVRRTASHLCVIALCAVGPAACEMDSYIDPSRTGYFEHTPTTMPVLARIDVIEPPEEPLGVTGPPELQDLIANTLKYRLAPGDQVNVDIYELITQGRTEQMRRTVDPGGFIRLPTINEVRAGGLTLEELRLAIKTMLEPILKNPVVSIDIEQGRSFEFTINGAIQNPGVYALDKPNFRLTQALALANGAEAVTERVLVVRSMLTERDVDDAAKPTPPDGATSTTGGGSHGTPRPAPIKTDSTPVDIEALINQLGNAGTVPPVPAPTPAPAPTPEPVPPTGSSEPRQPAPGAVSSYQAAPVIDIDSLEPIQVNDQPVIDAATMTRRSPSNQLANDGDSFVFDVNSQQWVRLKGGRSAPMPPTISDPEAISVPGSALTGAAAQANAGGSRKKADPRAIFNTRIIEIEYDRLIKGDQSQNVIVRPGDEIYVQFPPLGVVYIDGEIQRPGVFQLPSVGRLTISRLVASAGGLTAIAIPERVDLVRTLRGGRQAAIRVNLAAIRNMSEPDIILKKDDHVIIGTNFWATPLAVIRNGFRMTYGFGFLLDRNWGNDVFGPPPQQETVNF